MTQAHVTHIERVDNVRMGGARAGTTTVRFAVCCTRCGRVGSEYRTEKAAQDRALRHHESGR